MDIKKISVILNANELNIGKTVELLETHEERTHEGIEKEYQKGKNKRQDE
jgi:hypothetical protein